MIPASVRRPIEKLVQLDRDHEAGWIRELTRIHRLNLERFAENLAKVEQTVAQMEAAGQKVSPWVIAQERRWENMIDEYSKGVDGMAREAQGWAESAPTGPAQMIDAAKESVLAGATGAPAVMTEAAFQSVDWSGIAAAIANDQSERMKLLTSRLAPDAAKRMRDELVYGISSGQSFAKTARRLRDVASIPLAEATVITRTEGITTMRDSLLQVYNRSPAVKGWIWWSTSDLRTCILCLARHGEHCTGTMNSHPNCRCTMLPDIEQLDGAPPWKPDTGEDRLRAMSEAEQRKLLGDARYEMWQNGTPLDDMWTGYQHGPYSGMRAKTLGEIEATSSKAARFPDDMKMDALSAYQDGATAADLLRSGKPLEDLQDYIEALDELITDQPPIGIGEVVYRGVGYQADSPFGRFIESLKPGDTFTDRAFLSTTKDEGIASDFGRNMSMGLGEESKTIRITFLRGGCPGLDTQKAGGESLWTRYESEVLLPRGTKFRVTGNSDQYLDVVWDGR